MQKNYRKLKKLLLVKEFGSKCAICQYDKCITALEFHHINEDEKNFAISQSKNIKWEILLNEAKKCILVCCRCHREIHEGLHNLSKYVNEVNIENLKEKFRCKTKVKCLTCGNKTYNEYFCSIKCSAKNQERIKWNDEKLIDMFCNKKINVNKISKMLELSYNTVKKRLIKLNVWI